MGFYGLRIVKLQYFLYSWLLLFTQLIVQVTQCFCNWLILNSFLTKSCYFGKSKYTFERARRGSSLRPRWFPVLNISFTHPIVCWKQISRTLAPLVFVFMKILIFIILFIHFSDYLVENIFSMQIYVKLSHILRMHLFWFILMILSESLFFILFTDWTVVGIFTDNDFDWILLMGSESLLKVLDSLSSVSS